MDVSCHTLGGPQLDHGLVTTVINHVVVVLSAEPALMTLGI